MSLRETEVKSKSNGQHAIVIGASMAGLLAARVLSDHFARVTLIERDHFPEGVQNRKGVPQDRHLHVLLVKGEQIIARFFPGLPAELAQAGAVRVDLPGDLLWFHQGGYKTRHHSGIAVLYLSRPLLETFVRRRVLAIKNLTCLEGHDVLSLVASEDRTRVTGVQIRPRVAGASETILDADLVIDATGRGSKSPRWLDALGYSPPEESVVKVDVGYTTRLYRQNTELLPNAKGILIMPVPPKGKRAGALFPIEEGRWIVSLAGGLNDHPPADERGFLEYASSLASQDVYRVISRAEPLTDFSTYRIPSNLRRHYERMSRFPEGYVVMGDAICSFNPVYAQGMSVGALEAEALDRCLQEARARKTSNSMARAFFRRAAKVIDTAWRMAAGEDFRFPGVEGDKPLGTELINWYVSRVHHTTLRDFETTRAFIQVMTMTHPPQTLFRPNILLRVAKHCLASLNFGNRS